MLNEPFLQKDSIFIFKYTHLANIDFANCSFNTLSAQTELFRQKKTCAIKIMPDQPAPKRVV